MNPEEKVMIQRALELSEENHRMLLSLKKNMHLAMIWGFVKFFVIVVPLVISFFYLQPYLGSVGQSFIEIRHMLNQ
jgi:hypothetical protein